MELNFGKRIRRVRKFMGLTQAGFANAIGISNGHISNVERNQDVLSDRVITTLCRAYGVSEEWLRDGTGQMMLSKQNDHEEDNMAYIEKEDKKMNDYTQQEAMETALKYALNERDLNKALSIAATIHGEYGYSKHLEAAVQRIMKAASLRDNGVAFCAAACLYRRIHADETASA